MGDDGVDITATVRTADRTGIEMEALTAGRSPPTTSRTALAGETWSARTSQDGAVCQPGQEVQVVSIEGATVIVTGVTAGQKAE